MKLKRRFSNENAVEMFCGSGCSIEVFEAIIDFETLGFTKILREVYYSFSGAGIGDSRINTNILQNSGLKFRNAVNLHRDFGLDDFPHISIRQSKKYEEERRDEKENAAIREYSSIERSLDRQLTWWGDKRLLINCSYFEDRNFPVVRIYEIVNEEGFQLDAINFPPKTLNWFNLRSVNDTEVGRERFRKVFDSRNSNFVEKTARKVIIEHEELSMEPNEQYKYCKDWE